MKVPLTWKVTGWSMIGWHCQEHIERPARSRVDAKPDMAIRKQFYGVPPTDAVASA